VKINNRFFFKFNEINIKKMFFLNLIFSNIFYLQIIFYKILIFWTLYRLPLFK
jgi:hypothetical protein